MATLPPSKLLPGPVAHMEPICSVQIWSEIQMSGKLFQDEHQPDDQPEVLPEEGQLHGEGQVPQDIVQLQVPCDHRVHVHSGDLEEEQRKVKMSLQPNYSTLFW